MLGVLAVCPRQHKAAEAGRYDACEFLLKHLDLPDTTGAGQTQAVAVQVLDLAHPS
jgi:hypothetical protein